MVAHTYAIHLCKTWLKAQVISTDKEEADI